MFDPDRSETFFVARLHDICDLIFYLLSRFSQTYLERRMERRGMVPSWPRTGKRRYWIHAASLGEVRLALRLETMLQAIDDSVECVVTTMTSSASIYYAQHGTSRHYFVPYDTPYALKRFLDAICPDALFLIETELWPYMLASAHKKSIPIVIINGRLGKKSQTFHAYCGQFSGIRHIAYVAAASEEDAQTFRILSRAEVVHVGQFKWCVVPAISHHKKIHMHRWCMLWASVQWGESSAILKACQHFRSTKRKVTMIIAPRRIEDMQPWINVFSSYKVVSSRQWKGEDVDIILVDVFGLMDQYYAVADLVFVGGSLVKHGGQNVLEPACHGKCVLIGPYSYNFAQVIAMMKEERCVIEVGDQLALMQQIEYFYTHPQRAQECGERAQFFYQALHDGTVLRYTQWLESLMEDRL